MAMKKCTKCGEIKTVNLFNRDRSKSDGLYSSCSKCTNKIKKEYYEKQKHKLLSKMKEYYQKNRDKIISRAAVYFKKNTKKVSDYRKKWYEKNRKKQQEYSRRYYKKRTKNFEKIPRKKIHGMSNTRPYRVWVGMLSRCNNTKAFAYKDYGGRGIRVCPRWSSFINFWEDMKSGYDKNLSIDRINNDGNYCKDNCRWATPLQQVNNRRNSKFLTYKGRTQTISQWGKELNIKRNTLRMRLYSYKWSVKKSLETLC